MTILLTSFAPWLCHHRSNSSDDLLVSIQDNCPKNLLFLRQLPVNTHRASERFVKAIQDKKPDLVICCGMAESRYRLSLESQARSSTKKLLTSMRLIGNRGTAAFASSLELQATLCFHCAARFSQPNGSHTC